MRKSIFIAPILAIALAGCSNDEPAANGGGDTGDANYIAVNVATAPVSRATGTDGKEYEDGSSDENEVGTLRFYFFDEKGVATNVKTNGNTRVNYVDADKTSDAGKDPVNVEKIIEAVFIINTSAGDEIPAQIVAVVNRPEDLTTVSSIDDLKTKLSQTGKNATGNFTMSNSVYASGTTEMMAVDIKGKLFPTEAAALANPVTIHIERVLAKVRMTVDTEKVTPKDADNNIFEIKDEEFNDKRIYVKFLGWNVTSTANKAYLMKHINTGWSDNLLGTNEPWNNPTYFRSYWAINPTLKDNSATETDFTWGPFNTENALTAANAIKDFTSGTGKTNYTYLLENAEKNNDANSKSRPSQVIIAAQLVDENGSPIEFAEWAFERMEVSKLPEAIANHANLYKKSTNATDGSTKFVKITPEEIKIITATEAGEAGKDNAGRYYVYANLTTEAAKETWYSSNSEDAQPLAGTDAANNILEGLGGAKVWKNGFTYYYFDIHHLNTDIDGTGYLGVVRNHLYAANITALQGLGTPVYNPDEVIYPEKPVGENTFIAAEVRILSWRLVNQDIELKW